MAKKNKYDFDAFKLDNEITESNQKYDFSAFDKILEEEKKAKEAQVNEFLKDVPQEKTFEAKQDVTKPIQKTTDVEVIDPTEEQKKQNEVDLIELGQKNQYLNDVSNTLDSDLEKEMFSKLESYYDRLGYKSPSRKIYDLQTKISQLGREATPEEIAQFADQEGLSYDSETGISLFPNDQKLLQQYYEKSVTELLDEKQKNTEDPFMKDVWARLNVGAEEFGRGLYDMLYSTTGIPMFKSTADLAEYQRNKWAEVAQRGESSDIIGMIQSGDTKGAVAESILQLVEQTPNLIALAMGNAAGYTKSTLGVMGGQAATGKYRELKDSDLPEYQKYMSSIMTGLNEIIFESVGTVEILDDVRRTIKEMGEAEAKKQLQQLYYDEMHRIASGVFQGTNNAIKEGASEWATEFSNNLVDKAMNPDADVNLFENTGNSFIVGMLMGKGMSLPVDVVNAKNYLNEKLNSLPKDFPAEKKIEATELMVDRDRLKQQQEKEDEAFKGQTKEKIDEINTKLQEMQGEAPAKPKQKEDEKTNVQQTEAKDETKAKEKLLEEQPEKKPVTEEEKPVSETKESSKKEQQEKSLKELGIDKYEPDKVTVDPVGEGKLRGVVGKMYGEDTKKYEVNYGGEKIGQIETAETGNNVTYMNISLDKGKGLGIGKDMMRKLNKQLSSKGQVLKSTQTQSKEQTRVWESLVKSGEAVKKSEGQYEMVPANQLKKEQQTEKIVDKKLEQLKEKEGDKLLKEQKKRLLDDITSAEDILLGAKKDEVREREAQMKKDGISQDIIDNEISQQYDLDNLSDDQIKQLKNIGIEIDGNGIKVDIYRDGTIRVGDLRTALNTIQKQFPAKVKRPKTYSGAGKTKYNIEDFESFEQVKDVYDAAENNLKYAKESGVKGLIKVTQEEFDKIKPVYEQAKDYFKTKTKEEPSNAKEQQGRPVREQGSEARQEQGVSDKNMSDIDKTKLQDRKSNKEETLEDEVEGEAFAKQTGKKKTTAKETGVKKSEPTQQKKEQPKEGKWIEEDKMTNEGLKGIETPEIIQISKDLIEKYPTVKSMRKALGTFFHTRKGNQWIALDRSLFAEENADLLAKVIAHEFGHLIDYLPDKTMAHGNILGRIANLKNYLEHTLPEVHGKENILTKEDRERIRRLAKKELEKEYEAGPIEIIEEILREEPIYEDATLTAQDILDIWNTNHARENNPELYEYIAKLSPLSKKNIIKQAMKGLIDTELVKRFSKGKQIGTKTTKEIIKKVKYPDPVTKENIEEKFRELLDEEINKRHLFENEVISEELKELTKWWNPFDEKADKSYTKYRYSVKELYAEAISVLLNNPQAVAEKAPYFNRAFFNYFSEKPTIKQLYDEVQDLMNKPREELLKSRMNRMYEGYKKADEKRVENLEKKEKKLGFFDRFTQLYVSKSRPFTKKISSEKKLSKHLDKKQYVRDVIEKMEFVNEEIGLFLTDIHQNVIDILHDSDISLNDFRAILELERNLTERQGKANPYGFQQKESAELLAFINDKFSDKQADAMKKALQNFHNLIFDRFDAAHKEGVFSDKQFEIIEKNRDTYATFGVVDYMDKNYISPNMRSATGTLKEVEPFISTLFKTASVVKATTRQKAVKATIESLQEVDPDNISKSKKKGDRFVNEPGRGRIEYYEDGKWTSVTVDPYIAKIFEPKNLADDMILGGIRKFNRKFKPLVTTFNLGWAYFSNVLRDNPRTLLHLFTIMKSTKGVNWLKSFSLPVVYPGRLIKNLPQASKFVQGKLTPLIREMIEEGVLTHDWFGSYDMMMNEEIGTVFKQNRLITQEKSTKDKLKEKSIILRGLIKILDMHVFAAKMLEVLPKMVAFDTLKKSGFDPQASAFYTRNYTGTPNYKEGGVNSKVTNDVLIFSNVIVQSLRTDAEMALKPQTRGAYWMATTMSVLTPAVLVAMAASGLMGDDTKEAYDQMSEYDKTNFVCIPISKTDGGKWMYVRMPMPELSRLLYSIMYKSTSAAIKEEGIKNPEQILAVWANLTPNPTPLIEILKGSYDMVQGKNIQDNWTGKDVFTEDEMKAAQKWEGKKYKGEKYLQWVVDKTGGHFIVKAFDYDPVKNTTQEYWLKLTPIVSRAIKIGGSGQRDVMAEAKKLAEAETAIERIERRKKIKEVVVESMKEGLNLNKESDADKMYDMLKEKLYGSKTVPEGSYAEYRRAKKMLKTQYIKGVETPFSIYVEQIMYTSENKVKIEMLKAYYKDFGYDQTKELMTYLRQNNIISAPVKYKVEQEMKLQLPD